MICTVTNGRTTKRLDVYKRQGLGSAPIAAAAAKTKDTVRQGLVSMTGTFIDTIVSCTMTGLAIVISVSWANPDLKGVAITTRCVEETAFLLALLEIRNI